MEYVGNRTTAENTVIGLISSLFCLRHSPVLLLFVLPLLCEAALANEEWQVIDGTVARAPAIRTTDGLPASLEVRCQPEPEIRLTHPSLAELPAEEEDRRPGWYGVVQTVSGFGLDLNRPDHHGAIDYWWRCESQPDCLIDRDPRWTLDLLKSEFTWFIRIEPPGRANVDLRISLHGSRRAIEAVCPSLMPEDTTRHTKAP